MSVTETYEPVLLETDGIETDFDFDFSVFEDTDVVVALVDPDTLVATAQTLGVDYTVTLNTSTVGGTVVFGTAPADGQLVSIRRDIPTTQGTDIPSGGLFRESQIEKALDKAILLIQQLEEQIARALLQNPYTTALSLGLPAPEAGTVLGWNDDEDALENKTLVDLAAVALATQAQAEAGVNNTVYMSALRTKQAIDSQVPAIVASEIDALVPAIVASEKVRVGTGAIVSNELDINAALYDVVNVAVDDDFTLNIPTGGQAGQRVSVRLTQDASGDHALTLHESFLIASELVDDGVVLSTAAGSIDKIGLYCVDGTVWEVEAFGSDYAVAA